jgi:hypothetical protein
MAYTSVDDPTIYFNTKLYTGNGSTGHAITGVGFQPDWVWIKSRDEGSGNNHNAFDVIRGASKGLQPNDTDAEYTASSVHESFDTDGFTLGDNGQVNGSSENFVSWNWKAGGSASSNTDGSITSSVSANTTAGFNIVSWTGTGSTGTVGHGLGATPSMIIIKERNNATSWIVYHHKNTSAPATDYLLLNSTQATDDYADYFNDTEPTSSVFTIDTAGDINGSSDTYIAYCFAEKKGYSKFGSYLGSGSTSIGSFIHTGFKPAWVLLKQTDSAGSWNLYDNKRNGFNVDNDLILVDAVNAEANATFIDFLSNGFKIRDTDDDRNASNGTYIYMAFAESPFTNSNGIPNNAR